MLRSLVGSEMCIRDRTNGENVPFSACKTRSQHWVFFSFLLDKKQNRLKTLTSKNALWPTVQKLRALMSSLASLELFACLGRSSLPSSLRRGSILTPTHTSSRNLDVMSLISLCLTNLRHKSTFLARQRMCKIKGGSACASRWNSVEWPIVAKSNGVPKFLLR